MREDMDKRKKANIILFVTAAVFLLAAGVILIIINAYKRDYSSDSAKKMWDGAKYSYAQVSLFLPPENGLDPQGIFTLRRGVEEKLKESSVLNAEDNPPGRLWIDCASGEANAAVSANGKSVDVKAAGTYGDYFYFHPGDVMYGSCYTDEDANIDRIVIDRECSWQLYGALNTVGMPVTVGNRVYYIAAVVKSPDNERDKKIYGEKPRVYMHYESLKETAPGLTLTAYEFCIPEVVKDFAVGVMKDINTAGERCAIADQSGRFDIITLVTGRNEIAYSAVSEISLSYPWEENRTRAAELMARIAAAFLPYLLIFPVFYLVYLIFAFVKLIGKGARAVRNKAEDRYQKKISEIYYKKHKSI